MRIVIVTPYGPPSPRGNAVTAGRISGALRASGHDVLLITVAEASLPGSAALVGAFEPDVIQAIHAGHAGPVAGALADALGVPLVVSIRGTDVDVQLADARTKPTILGVLGRAAAVTALNEGHAAAVLSAVPALGGRVFVVRSADAPAPGVVGVEADPPVFLLVAGVRPIKRPGFAIAPLGLLNAERATLGVGAVRFEVVGPALDEAELGRLLAAMAGAPWSNYAGEMAPNRVHERLARAAVALNTSAGEGLSNAVLEAMAAGKPVLASRVSGNKALVDDGVTGLLFSDEGEFLDGARALAA